MSEHSLSSLLDKYADLVAGLPVPGLLEPANPIEAQVVEAPQRVLALGARVTDRLLPGATTEEIDEAEIRLGCPLIPGAREWFSWRHAHKGGVFDEDDRVAYLLPFGRQLDLATAELLMNQQGTFLDIMRAREPEIPHRPFLLLQGSDRYFYIECAGNERRGAIWYLELEFEYRYAFDSFPSMVEHAMR